jgi:acetylornithine deacetylase
VAADALRKDGLEDVGLLFVVDEEVASVGARAANRHPWAASCRYLINGEPTENQLAVAAKGSLQVEIRTTGTGGHAAYPERGRSAVHELLAVLDELRRADWPSEEVFGKTTLNIGKISGGSAPNVLAPEAHALMQFRCAADTDRVLTRLREVVGTRASIEVGSATPPMRLKAMGDLPTCVVAYTTDIPHLSAWGTPLLFGPGSIADAHMPNERIAKADLVAGVARYIGLVRSLFTST